MLGFILKPIFKLAAMCGAVLFGTVFLAGMAVFPLHYMLSATPQIMRTIGAGVPVLCFGAGISALVFAREWRVLKYTAPVGFLAPFVVFGVSFFIVIPNLLLVTIAVVSSALFIIDLFTGRISGEPWFGRTETKTANETSFPETDYPVAVSNSTTSVKQVGGFEVVENPEDYIQSSETIDQKVWEPFRNIVRAMMAFGAPVGYRLERISGVTREYYLTLGRNAQSLRKNMDLLQRLLDSLLPKFRFQQHDRLTSPHAARGVVGTLSGELLTAEDPRQRSDPLTVVAEALLRMENGVFQTFALPVSSGITQSFRRVMTGREYKSKMQKAQHTVSTKRGGLFSRGGEVSSTVVDIASATEADRLYQRYQRYRVKHACDAEISVTCWGSKRERNEQDIRLLLEITKSTVTPGDPAKDLKIRIHKGTGPFSRVIEGRPIGKATLHTPEEVAILFTLPRCDIGIARSKREKFSTATKPVPKPIQSETRLVPTESSGRRLVHSEWKLKTRKAIVLGNPIGANGHPIITSLVWFRPQKFESHLAIYGNIRSGKTTTALSVVAQAMKCGLKVLILVPRRSSDWTILMHLFPDSFWIFKAGASSDLSPRINMFRPPPRVQVASWIRALGDLLSSWMPNDRVMRMHLDDVLHTTYRNSGWDPKSNKRGRPILLDDFWNAVEEVCTDIPYGDEVRQNFYGAIYSRVSNLLRNKVLVDMYNTEEGITWDQLAEHNILIDSEKLPSDEDRSFLMGLLSMGVHMYKMAHPTREMTNLVVFEEASYVLKRPQGSDHYGPDVGHFAVDRIVDILTTGGGNGLGVIVLEQVPSRLMVDVVKLIVNTVAHSLGDESERVLVGGHIGVDAKKSEHLQQLGKGETVIYLEGDGSPRSVKILPLNMWLDSPLPDNRITENEIEVFMEPVFREHTNLRANTELPEDIINRIERARPRARSSPDSGELVQYRTRSRMGLSDSTASVLKSLIQNPRFSKLFYKTLRDAANGNPQPFVSLITKTVNKASKEDEDPRTVAEWIVSTAWNAFELPNNEPFQQDLMGKVAVELAT